MHNLIHVALQVAGKRHLMTIIDRPTQRLQLITFVPMPFSPTPLLILAFQPILFHAPPEMENKCNK